MINLNSDIYVTHIGIDRINLRGKEVDKFSKLPNAEINERKLIIDGEEKFVRTVIVVFENESEKINILQKFVDGGVPFTDDYKSTAYVDACKLKEQGKLTGKILGC